MKYSVAENINTALLSVVARPPVCFPEGVFFFTFSREAVRISALNYNKQMKITIVGTGYVGLVSGTCFAEKGHDVLCIDIDKKKIANLEKGIMPIYEPSLEELVKKNLRAERLRFSTKIAEGVHHAEVLFSAVGTPPDKDYKADLTAVKAVAKSFGEHLDAFKIFVNKSTVPVGTAELCEKIIAKELKKRGEKVDFAVVSNPEFLREGNAVEDTLKPNRIIVGTSSEKAREIMKKVYAPFVSTKSPLIFTKVKSAEIIKYAANCFLATKISFINEIATFCEKTGGDIDEVAQGMAPDDRIGGKFLRAGIGYGGSCFPKDIQALMKTGREYGYEFKILDAVEAVNKSQKKKLFKVIHTRLKNLEDKTIAVLGLAFKPDTDDMRDAPSIKIIKKLQADGALIQAFDPIAMPSARLHLSKVNLHFAHDAYEAVKNADAVLVLTEWDEFKKLDFRKIKSLMKGNIVIDGRNMFLPADIKKWGLEYVSIGRS